jgi:hypothetical protein
MRGACVFSACHDSISPGGGLNLEGPLASGTMREALVGVSSCQYDLMPLVDPGNPDNSWLWLKLSGPHTAANVLEFTASPTWIPDPRPECPTPPMISPFGVMMPQGSSGLDPMRANIVRGWILAGAPGPTP